MRAFLAGLAVASLAVGCATLPKVELRQSTAPSSPELLAAADAFYAATTVAALESSLASARKANPDSAITHELAAELSLLKGDDRGFVAELSAALQDPGDPDPLLHLNDLGAVEWTPDERTHIVALLETLATVSPNAEVRAAASFRLAGLWTQLGRPDLAARSRSRVTGRLEFSVIGGWDNDQGKAFTTPLPPEVEGYNKSAEYEGILRPLDWRSSLPTNAQGSTLLSSLVEPTRFSVAFATSVFSVPADTDLELRLRSTEPVIVYVDGTKVAELREVREAVFDHIVIPLFVPKGAHRVLIKSARNDDSGEWSLLARVTAKAGAPLEALSVLPPETDVPPTVLRAQPLSEDAVLERRFGAPGGSARSLANFASYSREFLGGVRSVKAAESFAGRNPESIEARLSLLDALWSNAENGRANDVISALGDELGSKLPAVALARAETFQKQGVRQKARDTLIQLVHSSPSFVEAHASLARTFAVEGWIEDECSERQTLVTLEQRNAHALLELSGCLIGLGKEDQGERLIREAVAQLPGDENALSTLEEFARDRSNWELAEWAARERVRNAPEQIEPHLALADILKYRQRFDEAREELAAVAKLSPDLSSPYAALATIEYRAGNKNAAIAAWREALARAPDAEGLATRLEFLAPEAPESWEKDIPTETMIDAAVKAGRAMKPIEGASAAFVLDHEVASLKGDGTVDSVVTLVLQAFGANGRDELLKQRLSGGNARVRLVYAIDDQGRRVEPVSVRGGEVRFRGLGEHSTVVLQYRRKAPYRGMIGHTLALDWMFQSLEDARVRSELVLYVPKGTELKEFKQGAVERSESEVSDLRRIVWSAHDVPPAGYEVGMPNRHEVVASLSLTTVPSWDVFSEWTQALFQDATRESPELKDIAARLFDGVSDKNERLDRLQTFVMKEVRYEQDYETFISGVKPHPAPMVLERRYGDCKDKTVLFMTLARLGGIDTNYALVRMRNLGPVHEETPKLQFNHVIVYVPKQPGISEERYLDPTADALDPHALPRADVGTLSFVINPRDRSWRFQEIPFQPPTTNALDHQIEVALSDDGSAKVQVREASDGEFGSLVRRAARNEDVMKRAISAFASAIYPGSSLQSVDGLPDKEDITHPAAIALTMEAPSAAKREGDELRAKLPITYSPASRYRLSERKHALLLDVPMRSHYSGDVKLSSATIARLPQSTEYKSPCLDFARTVTANGDTVHFDQTLDEKCERIPPERYAEAKRAAVEVQRLLDEEIVFSLSKPKPAKVKVAPEAAQTPP